MSDIAVGANDQIRLTLPAVASYARVARLTIPSVAARLGYSYDDIEDLRIAVGEICNVLVGPEDSRITFTCRVHEQGITIDTVREPSAPSPEIGELSRQILSGVVDVVEVDADQARMTVTKRFRG